MRASIVILCAALTGCGGGEGKPLKQARSPEERRAGSGDPRKTGFWEQLAARGVDELAARIAERGSDQRPTVRVRRPVNKTPFHIDTEGLARRIEASLTASGRFKVIAADTWEAADQAPDLAPGEAAELRLASELSAERSEADGQVTTTGTLTLTLIQSSDGSLVESSRRSETTVEASGR